jgi:hypothetical protein
VIKRCDHQTLSASHGDEGLAVKCRHCVVEDIVHAAIHVALATRFPGCNRPAHFRAPLPPRPIDRAHDPVTGRRAEWNVLPARAFERETMLVIAARRVRPQRRDANSIFNFGGLRTPLLRRPIRFRRHPSFDVPAVNWKIFRQAPHLDRFASRVSVRVAVRPASADPREPRAAPHHAKVRLAIKVHAARARGAFLHRRRRFMRFSCDLNQGELLIAKLR